MVVKSQSCLCPILWTFNHIYSASFGRCHREVSVRCLLHSLAPLLVQNGKRRLVWGDQVFVHTRSLPKLGLHPLIPKVLGSIRRFPTLLLTKALGPGAGALHSQQRGLGSRCCWGPGEMLRPQLQLQPQSRGRGWQREAGWGWLSHWQASQCGPSQSGENKNSSLDSWDALCPPPPPRPPP